MSDLCQDPHIEVVASTIEYIAVEIGQEWPFSWSVGAEFGVRQQSAGTDSRSIQPAVGVYLETTHPDIRVRLVLPVRWPIVSSGVQQTINCVKLIPEPTNYSV